MAKQDCHEQHPLRHNGQTQTRRLPPALDTTYFRPDERSVEELMAFAYRYAAELLYVDVQNKVSGNWQGFLESAYGKTLAELDQMPDHEPHFALFLCFLKLFGYAQDQMNTLTRRHLEYYYEKILQIKRRAPQPDHAHLVFELAKNASEALVKQGTRLTAGKDATGRLLYYEVEEDTLLNRAALEHRRSILNVSGRQHIAPIAASTDGMGEAPLQTPFYWPPFGSVYHPAAPTGFAVAAPVLRLSDGLRNIRIALHLQRSLAGKEDAVKRATDALQCYLTGPKGWIGPLKASSGLSDAGGASKNVWNITLSLSETTESIVPYSSKMHGSNFNTAEPLIRLLFDADIAADIMPELSSWLVRSVRIEVDVERARDLDLDSSEGPLEAGKPFAPFGGVRPLTGSHFFVNSEEIFSKPLQQLNLNLQWLNTPSSGTFKSTVRVHSGSLANTAVQTVSLFPGGNTAQEIRIPPLPFIWAGIWAPTYFLASTIQTRRVMSKRSVSQGAFALSSPVAQSLIHGKYLGLRLDFLPFLFEKRPRRGLDLRLQVDGGNQDKPFIPKLSDFSIDYKAATPDEVLSSEGNEEAKLDGRTIQFFQLGAFGQREIHPHLRPAFVPAKNGAALTAMPEGEGELLLGFKNLGPRQSLNLLFQVQEGSADPDLEPPVLEWSVLASNHWRPLDHQYLLYDRTEGLQTSGLVRCIIPPEVTTDNTWLEAGLIWLRIRADRNTKAVCRIENIHPQGVSVRFVDDNNSPDHLSAPLPPGKIGKLVLQEPAIKKVHHLYPSFGGRPEEPSVPFYTRVSERLRHKQRAVSIWDMERLVLEHFPSVFQAKCISHCSLDSEIAPGHVTMVVIPDYRHYVAGDPLQPKLSLHTLQSIEAFLEQYGIPGAQFHVQNPLYERILLEFKVAFHWGFEFGFYQKQLTADINRILSPWTDREGRGADFDGRYYHAALVYAIEQLEYVDYLTHFQFYLLQPDGTRSAPLKEASATRARAIIVPAGEHLITPVD